MAHVQLLLHPDESLAYSAETHILAHELSYPPSTDLLHLLAVLRDVHATGCVSIHLAQGGVCAIRFRHERRVEL